MRSVGAMNGIGYDLPSIFQKPSFNCNSLQYFKTSILHNQMCLNVQIDH